MSSKWLSQRSKWQIRLTDFCFDSLINIKIDAPMALFVMEIAQLSTIAGVKWARTFDVGLVAKMWFFVIQYICLAIKSSRSIAVSRFFSLDAQNSSSNSVNMKILFTCTRCVENSGCDFTRIRSRKFHRMIYLAQQSDKLSASPFSAACVSRLA